MKMTKISKVFLALAGLLLLWGQSVHAVTSVSADTTYSVLTSNTAAVMFDVRTVDEHYGCQPPWDGTSCLVSVDALSVTPKWIAIEASGLQPEVTRLPFNIPYWNTEPGSGGIVAPEEWEEVRLLIGSLLETGAITHSTPIYLLCRSGYRSYYMTNWMEGTTFAPGDGSSSGVGNAPFTALYNIDADADQFNGLGGMEEWIRSGLPVWDNWGDGRMPPMVFGNTPLYGEVFDTNDVPFRMTILEPTAGSDGAITGYAPQVRTCINISDPLLNVFSVCDATDTPLNSPVTYYDFIVNLADGDWGWNSFADNTLESWGPYATDFGLDNRSLTVSTTIDPLDVDDDGDGFTENEGDCDDTNSSVYPGADDSDCNGVDNDCNGLVDDGYVVTDTACGVGVCAATGLLECNSGILVDSCVAGTPTEDPEVSCTDSLDNDCDGAIDGADSDCLVSCTDNDGDGYCEEIDDCDDNNAAINPGADDSQCDGVDNNCDSVVDDGYVATSTTCGVGACASTGLLECVSGAEVDSCVEGTAETEGPIGDATCSDGLDNDCDGAIDVADPGCVFTCTDNDGDGYAVEGGDCGLVDCNDSNAGVNPGAVEICDGVDNDCDGSVDEGFDADGDGYTTCGGDCDDTNPDVSLGATEGPVGDATCSDGLDNDCDGAIDDADSGCVETTDRPTRRRRSTRSR